MSRENVFYLMKLFYLIMILYITNIPTTQEEKNKQPHRKMGEENNRQFMKKETQMANENKKSYSAN